MNNNIYLIGMMGSGKSTIGELLSKNIYYEFIDVDEFIVEHSEFESINEIFENKNEKFFRTLEKEAMDELSNFNKTVIATGGGVVLDQENINKMETTGLVIYLQSNIKNLINHLEGSDNRPLLKDVDLENKLKKLFDERENLYKKAANFIVRTNSKGIEEIINKIIETLEGDYDEYISD